MTRDTFFAQGLLNWHRILTKISERNAVENNNIRKLCGVDQAYEWISDIAIHIQVTDFHWYEYFENGNIREMVTDFNLTCAEENQIIDTFDLSLLILLRNCTSQNACDAIKKIFLPEIRGFSKHSTVTGWSVLDNLRSKYANKKVFDLIQLSRYFDSCVLESPSWKIQYLDHICAKYMDYGETEFRECKTIYPSINKTAFEAVTKYHRHRINMLLKYLKFPEYQMEFIDLLSSKTLFELSNEDLIKMTSLDIIKESPQEDEPSKVSKIKADDAPNYNNKLETTTPLNIEEDIQDNDKNVEDMETDTPHNITNEDKHGRDFNNRLQIDARENVQESRSYLAQAYPKRVSEAQKYRENTINRNQKDDDKMMDWFNAFL
ncbi:hypothetical protein C6P45_004373 [Maudiozyma exigua]|uniref:Uncharacterized protein n=1 Tax=Maudiozyma exigua TaxID=34358 RepID=A0A9P7BAF8_MAUEX|nr:hypothetical protein C6P45_004373 [Kazachstania exigua]